MKTSARSVPTTLVSLAILLTATLPLAAQLTPQQDPANLAGERVSAPALADTLPINHGALALQQLLRKLRTRASFMLIVAHPDDEDNGGLTYLSRGQGARVATLTLNRGEGGQNLMSADFEDALGIIRTQELLAADRYMDTDQFFGTEIDFGFTKTKEEAFAKWTHERVLYDAVRAIRLYRPLVIASVFIGEPSDGHGQHQVSGEIAQEAFKAAGDPSVFPDQIAAGLQPWQPLKVYARSPFGRIDAQGMYDYATSQYVSARFENYVTGKVTTTVPKANVVVPEGDTDPLLGGISYAQLGRTGRALQKSQIGGAGGGGFGPGGRADVSYHRYGSMLNQPDGDDSGLESGFFDGIDTSFPGIASLAPDASDKFRPILETIDQQIANAQAKFDPAKPELIAPQLRQALSSVDSFIHELENPAVNDLPPLDTYNLLHELHIKRVQLNNALVLAHGITLTATVHPPGKPDATAADLLTTQAIATFRIEMSFTGNDALRLVTANLSDPAGERTIFTNKATTPLPPHYELVHAVEFVGGLPATRPYFSRPDIEQPFYDISVPALRDAPATPDPLTVSVTLSDNGVPLTLITDVAGSQPGQPAVIVPPVSVSVSPSVGIITHGNQTVSVTAQLRGNAVPSAGFVTLTLPNGKPADGKPQPFSLQRVDEGSLGPAGCCAFSVPAAAMDGKPTTLSITASEGGHSYSEGYRAVGYGGLAYTNYYTPATFRAVPVDVATAPSLNLAYIPGTGDDVPTALSELGIPMVHLLTPNPTPESLKPYDAIVLGVRAWEAHRDLSAIAPALLAYAQAGGVVIVQYVGRDLPTGAAPYPLSLGSNEKVVDEDAPVKLLAPADPLLNWPNKISPADFNGWVEERGHGFMSTWDSHYTPLLETHDPGQQPQLGGLLYTRTGKGAWIYLGLALYRQLPEGVPGAYRLFANLISAGKNPAFEPK